MLTRLLLLLSIVLHGALGASNSCDGKIVILLDAATASDAFSKDDFKNQNDLVKKHIASSYFNAYDRLVIGDYALDTNFSSPGDFYGQSDFPAYIDTIHQDPKNPSYLAYGLMSIYDYDFFRGTKGNTVVVFVSDIMYTEVADAKKYADLLKADDARVVLVGHGNFKDDYVSMERLVEVTGDISRVFQWKDGKSLPADDYHKWFRNVLGC